MLRLCFRIENTIFSRSIFSGMFSSPLLGRPSSDQYKDDPVPGTDQVPAIRWGGLPWRYPLPSSIRKVVRLWWMFTFSSTVVTAPFLPTARAPMKSCKSRTGQHDEIFRGIIMRRWWSTLATIQAGAVYHHASIPPSLSLSLLCTRYQLSLWFLGR